MSCLAELRLRPKTKKHKSGSFNTEVANPHIGTEQCQRWIREFVVGV